MGEMKKLRLIRTKFQGRHNQKNRNESDMEIIEDDVEYSEVDANRKSDLC